MSVRSSIIDQVIEDLVTIKRNNKKEEYPIDQLIIFLSSSRNIFS
jgi:hypothetical protein